MSSDNHDAIKLAPLGQDTQYVCHYDPSQLFSIERANNWQKLGYDKAPFRGFDLWNAYELSWLDPKGKPQVAIAEFRIPCDSSHIVESKSFKLYLNSFNLTRFDSMDQVQQHLVEDLSTAFGGPVTVAIQTLDATGIIEPLKGESLDQLDVEIEHYQPAPQLLSSGDGDPVDEQLYSHLLKSNCPVTGQPDWASIQIEYRGQPIDRKGLLKYLISYREHGDFHEQCVEQIFLDIYQRCQPEQLSVYARYVRRGGLDINPYRSTEAFSPDNIRLLRQ
ncbi:NADPH-dependent 7-cyano-7-deazaguanine reductase QueF [Motiliproteus sp.]|uniref:NADPH-dependent 7-cyano-7-deazaguanine reductase QueF n=1 Tax=Motiliproteus sp. TaxID=1898955 RepID=UPI003BAA6930